MVLYVSQKMQKRRVSMGRMLGSLDNPEELDRPDLNKCPDCQCYFDQDECPLCGKICPEEMRAGNRKGGKKFKFKRGSSSNRVTFVQWYHSWPAIILFLIFMPLIGIILLITSPHRTRYKVIFVSVIVTLVILIPTIIMAVFTATVLNAFKGDSAYADLTKEEYIARCDDVDMAALYRDPDGFLGDPMRLELVFVHEEYISGKNYYLCTDVDEQYVFFVRDCIKGEEKPYAGEVIIVYGECVGDLTLNSEGFSYDVIGINMFYFDRIGESSLEARGERLALEY